MADTPITRRAALRAIPALAAASAAPALASEPAETAPAKVFRLAKQLAAALDDLNADIFETDFGGEEVGVFIACVWPSKLLPNVYLEQRDVSVEQVKRSLQNHHG